MARKFLKDSEGLQLVTGKNNRSRAFQVAETIADDLHVTAVVTNVKDLDNGGTGLGIYLSDNKDNDLSPVLMEEAARLWNEFI